MPRLKAFGPGSSLGSAKTLRLPDPAPDLSGKVCIITGANSGIGFETAKYFLQQNAEVIMACRSASRAQEAKERLIQLVPGSEPRLSIEMLDLSQLSSVHEFVKRWNVRASQRDDKGKIDFLICNAGTLWMEKKMSADNLEMTYQANHLAHFLMTMRLLPFIALAEAPYARIINVASAASYGSSHLTSDNLNAEDYPDQWAWLMKFSRAFELYSRSKRIQIASCLELHSRLSSNPKYAHIAVHAVHPGFVATEIQNQSHLTLAPFARSIMNWFIFRMARTPAQGAMPTIWAALNKSSGEAGQGGKMWIDCLEVVVPNQCDDPEFKKLIWERSIKDAGLSSDQVVLQL